MADIIQKAKELLGVDQAKKEPVRIEDSDKDLVKKINLRVDEVRVFIEAETERVGGQHEAI